MQTNICTNLVLVLLFIAPAMQAQDVNYNYDRNTDFKSYKTYGWVNNGAAQIDPLLAQDIQRAVEGQLAQKALHKTDQGPDLLLDCQTAVQQEKRLDGWSSGPRWSAMGHATTSTVDVGTLVLSVYDGKSQRLIWRGAVSRELDRKADPDKNYRNLEKAVAKLLRGFPPKS